MPSRIRWRIASVSADRGVDAAAASPLIFSDSSMASSASMTLPVAGVPFPVTG